MMGPAVSEACVTIEDWMKGAECDDAWLIFSPSSRRNFRKGINPNDYKNHRKDKPAAYNEMVAELTSRFDHYSIEGLEADDTMGILQTSEIFPETTIVSIDKDMLTIPGRIYNPTKMHWPIDQTQLDAAYNWFYQMTIGDTADGFKGVPGIGPKRAEAILRPLKSALIEQHNSATAISTFWPVVHELFRAKVEDQSEADRLAILTARLARILHREDYDQETNTIRLWHPTHPERLKLDTFKVIGSW